MNRKVFLITPLAIFIFLLTACSGKKVNSKTSVQERVFQLKTDTTTGFTRMQPSSSMGDVVCKGEKYHYEVERIPCDSLPMIKDEQGNVFVDNLVRLTITRNENKKIISKVFTKKTFMNEVPSIFMKDAILEGFVFYEERTSDTDGLVFAASVCMPQTDLFYPLIVTVSLDGEVRIESDDIMMEILEPLPEGKV